MNEFLYHLQQARKANMGDVVAVIDAFNPQIQKYERRMGKEGDDVRQSLQLFLLELIQKPYMDEKKFPNDITAISYISRGLKHEFYHLCKRKSIYLNYEIPLNDEMTIMDYHDTEKLAIQKAVSENAWEYLTPREATILQDIYYKDWTIPDIAKKENISRQAVNQTKNRALAKIRQNLC